VHTLLLVNCPLYQNTTLCYTNMSKLRPYANVHYIKHYTFAMQNHKNCGHYNFPNQVSHHYTFLVRCPLYQNTTHFLYKHVKIASLYMCPLYQNTTLCYANMSKLRPYTSVHYIKTLHFSYTNMSKLRTLQFS